MKNMDSMMLSRAESSGCEIGKIKILIADDHPLMLKALKDVLEKEPTFEVVGEAYDGKEAVKLALELLPNVVIMDISMPELNGLEATRQIKAKFPNIAILVLTVHNDSEHIFGILEAGASGYLTKSVFGEQIIHSVKSVAIGESVLTTQVMQQLIKHASKYTTKPVPLETGEKLTAKELKILKLVARGMGNKDIASITGLSLRTVKSYLVDIFSKLDVDSRTKAVVLGLRAGLISLDDLE
jgi:DNA-binding NarL/FixJ family response regulator